MLNMIFKKMQGLMKPKGKKPLKGKRPFALTSFEDASILRKFSVLFLVSSIIPLALIFYTYLQFQSNALTIDQLNLAIIFMTIGILAGYASMRSIIVKTIQISQENRKVLENFLSPESVEDISHEENELVVLKRSFSAITQQLEVNILNFLAAKKTIQSLMVRVGEGVSRMENIDTFLQLIVETMTSAGIGKVGTLMLLDEKGLELTISAVHGVEYDAKKPLRIRLTEDSPLTQIIREKNPRTLSFPLMDDPDVRKVLGERLLCVPLVDGGKVNGLFTLSKGPDQKEPFTQEDLEIVSTLAEKTATAIRNTKFEMNIDYAVLKTITALAFAVDAKQKYRRGHIDRVTDYCMMVGKALGMDAQDLYALKRGARLHDVGKVGIPDSILLKDDPLTDEEDVLLRRHPEIGESIIKPIPALQYLCDLVRHHHERLDGSGYPDRLVGQDISPMVRILSIAELYDSLTTECPYRAKKSRKEAFEVMRSMKDQIDQNIVEVLYDEVMKQDWA
jgi:HD-GYP domain-containing protein (c-di-GMP phosphodiesterase class II)